MQYYTFDMDEPSRNLCTIATPFGLYHYCRLPMGVSKAPDIATEIMHDTFADMEDVEFYMDNIGCFSDSWNEHLQLLKTVLQRLQSVGLTINPLKCEWAVEETDFLGHWLTPTGIKPWNNKLTQSFVSNHPVISKNSAHSLAWSTIIAICGLGEHTHLCP